MLAGCGGGETTQTTEAQGTTATTVEASANKPQKQKAKNAKSEPAPVLKGKPPTPAAPLSNEGTKKVAPGVPTVKGGDNSIQEYGLEGPSGDRAEAALVLRAYLRARAAGEWARACSYLSAATKKELELLIARAVTEGEEPKPKGCDQTLRALGALTNRGAAREVGEIRVLSMRAEGAQAFLVYREGEGKPQAIAMDREDGRWLVGNLTGNALILGPGSP